MSAKAGKASNDKTMHTGAFAAAGQRLADTDDSLSSAPRGILIGQIAQILRAKKFDGTRGGQRLDIWLEEIDKAIIVNPDVFRQWKGDATDRSMVVHHRDSGVRFQPVPEGRITAPVMGSFTAGAAPGSPGAGGAGSAGTEPNPQHTITK